VTSLYSFLYHQDHFAELTGLPAWQLHRWLAMPPQEHAAIFARMHTSAPFETIQPQHTAPPREWRLRQEFVEKDGHPFRHDRGTDEWTQLNAPASGDHVGDGQANERRYIFSEADIEARLPIVLAAQQIAAGANDYVEAIVTLFGQSEFVISGGVVGTLYSCHWHVGLSNLFSMILEEPDLIEALSERILLQNFETIRRFAAAGGDAIYIDDATATSDMISPAHYRRFSLPRMKAMVEEIHRLGHKAIVIYYGGVMDRLDLIADTGADGFLYEASMKGFVNDTAEIARCIGNRMTLFSNIDPLGILQNGSEDDLKSEISRQLEAGRAARGFIISTASPITPATPLSRVRRFLELAREVSE
jgi:uroporphyrinogen-III decarboxylase